jgi:hypothetical protein
VAGATIARASQRQDPAFVLREEQVPIREARSSVVEGRLDSGSDPERMSAWLDGSPIPMSVVGDRFSVALPLLQPGGHLLETGIEYAGGIRRSVAIPVLAGPFAPPSSWISEAVELVIPQASLDDGDETTDSDLAGAVAGRLLEEVRSTPTEAGAAQSCELHVSLDDVAQIVMVRGVFQFTHGGVLFEIPLRVAINDNGRSLRFESTGARAVPDARLIAFARESGASLFGGLGGLALGLPGLLLGGLVGGSVAEDRARSQAQAILDEKLNVFLPMLGSTLSFPNRIPLGRRRLAAGLSLRFSRAPTVRAGHISVVIDALVDARGASDEIGPPLLGTSTATMPGDLPRLRIQPNFVAAVIHARSADHSFAADIETKLTSATPMDSPIAFTHVRIATPATLSVGRIGAIAWTLPDVALSLRDTALDVRAFVGGSVTVALRDDRRALRVTPRVDRLAISCRESAPGVVRFQPCLSDLTFAAGDLPSRLSHEIEPISLFEQEFARISSLGGDGPIRAAITPQSVTVGDPSGLPVVELTATIRFAPVARRRAGTRR